MIIQSPRKEVIYVFDDFRTPKIDPIILEQSRIMTEAKRKQERREVVKKALLSLAQSVVTAVITAFVLWLLGLN